MITTVREATIEDLEKIDSKAEIVNGEIVYMPPTGDEPGYAGDVIMISLFEYAKRTGKGRAVGDNKAFKVNLPNRKSFSPDAAFFTGKRAGMKFYEGAPVFAAEVRSEGDYGRRAEQSMAEKRRDYFAADTENPVVYRRSDFVEAEPAVPGWKMAVDDLFG